MFDRSRWLIPGLLCMGLLSILGIVSVVFLWGVYYQHWSGPAIVRAAQLLPIPAGKVGDRTVLLRDYLKDVSSIERYLSSEEATAQNLRRPVTDDDRKNALDRSLRVEALEELGDARGVTVTDQQMQALMNEMNVTATSTADFSDFIAKNYGWTMEDFQSHLARPLILTRLLAPAYAADHGGDPNALEDYLTDRLSRPDVVKYVKF
jgi:hypothetical protein